MKDELINVLLETLWPTRCILCDTQGTLLCPKCRLDLHYLDYWQACEVCGAPGGLHQCCECNSYIQSKNPTTNSLSASYSATCFDSKSAALVRAYKDQGEQRLSRVLARLMARSVPYDALSSFDAVSFIPATEAAYKRRGFDHGFLLAQEFAKLCRLPLLGLFLRPTSLDQRELGRQDRASNMASAFHLRPGIDIRGKSILLIDDVRTTGATLQGAASLLLEADARQISAVTFARVP